MSTNYGKNLNIEIYGGSHDSEIGIVAKGMPKGFKIDKEELSAFMKRRAPGQNSLSTQRKEPDAPEFVSGVSDDGVTLNGDIFKAIIRNTSARSSDYDNLSFVPRPSHADFAAKMKYGDKVDLRGGGHFSGRLTAPMCIVGGICLQYLKTKGIHIGAHLYSIGKIKDTPFDRLHLTPEALHAPGASSFSVIDPEASEAMKGEIECARMTADSVGGAVECAVIGLPVGVGDHPFDGMEGRISSILFSIPAVKAVAFGDGFDFALGYGSTHNDAYRITDSGEITTTTNHCGGIVGGMSTGMPVIFSCGFKPTPSIGTEQHTVSLSRHENTTLTVKGRHDPCIVPRAVPVVEAAAAVAVMDMLLD